jgi:hypothetical protein
VDAGGGPAARTSRGGIGISIGAGRLSVEYTTRSPPARAPIDGRRRALRLARAPRGPWERRAPWGGCRRGPICRAGGDDRPRRRSPLVAGRRGWAQVTGGASAGGRGARDAPRLPGARVDGGLRAPVWGPCAARVRRCVRIWSITDAWVMNAMIRMGPRHVGHASGSTSKICWRRAAVGPSPTGGRPRSAPAVARGRWRAARPRRRAPPCPACHGGGWRTSRRTAW